MLGDTLLNQWDTIDQLSNADMFGCFSAHVYASTRPQAQGMIGEVCVANLY
jgi:hypothetical protein